MWGLELLARRPRCTRVCIYAMPLSATVNHSVATIRQGAPGAVMALNPDLVTQYHTLSHFSALFDFRAPVDDSIRR